MTRVAMTDRGVKEESLGFQRTKCRTANCALFVDMERDFPGDRDACDRPLRVLIVDDHRATTDTLVSLVAIWGHSVRRAYDGVTGLQLASEFQPDVLLLDMLMAPMDGFEMTMQVRLQAPLRQCFIVAVTGRTDPAHRARCYAAGVDLCLLKPFPPVELRTLLHLEFDRLQLHRRFADVGVHQIMIKHAFVGEINEFEYRNRDYEIGRSVAIARGGPGSGNSALAPVERSLCIQDM